MSQFASVWNQTRFHVSRFLVGSVSFFRGRSWFRHAQLFCIPLKSDISVSVLQALAALKRIQRVDDLLERRRCLVVDLVAVKELLGIGAKTPSSEGRVAFSYSVLLRRFS
jgi:hypothetical protein